MISRTPRRRPRDVADACECPPVPKCTRPVPARLQISPAQATQHPRLQGISKAEALLRTRTADPLLTMEVLYQLS